MSYISLKVLISGNDGDGWIAEGLEVDYFAGGATAKKAADNFVKGLQDTIKIYNTTEGTDISNLLKPAPLEVWERFYGLTDPMPSSGSLSVFSESPLDEPVAHFPKINLAFLSYAQEAAKGFGENLR